MANNSIIEINNLKFGELFKNFDMSILEGTINAIIGPNNCGKTVLIKLIAGLLPSSKMIKYCGKHIEDINKRVLFNDIAYIISQDITKYNTKTVEEELLMLYENLNEEDSKRYREVVKKLHLKTILQDNPNDLSSYNEFLFRLAQIMVNDCKVLLVDDLCLNMTKKERENVIEILKKLDKTIIITTTNLEDITYFDHIYLVSDGNILIDGKPEEVLVQDNKISKSGLENNFMYDLSVKLKDYNLLDKNYLDMKGMVDALWK